MLAVLAERVDGSMAAFCGNFLHNKPENQVYATREIAFC
jgi:hypothetical protein